MKKSIITVIVITGIFLGSCKGKHEDKTATTTDQTQAGSSTPAAAAPAPASNMTITATPDTATLGKNSELVITVKNFKALQLSDPDGKVTGTELTYDIQATNKGAMGSGNITINPDNYRLELDNGTKISHESYNSFNVDAEATASSTGNKFKLDPGVKPVALDLFYDETRAVIKLTVQ